MRIIHPTGRPNFSIVLFGSGLQVAFSYETPVGFELDGRWYVRENSWGSTTGKHLNHLDGGGPGAKLDRLTGQDFHTRLYGLSIG